MKKFLRTIIVNFFSLFLISKFIGGVNYSDNLLVLFWAAFFLSVLNLLVKPILNILMTPINFLSLSHCFRARSGLAEAGFIQGLIL